MAENTGVLYSTKLAKALPTFFIQLSGWTVDKDCVVCINAETEIKAYNKAKELFGEKWSGITGLEHYNSEKAWEFFPRGIVATFKT